MRYNSKFAVWLPAVIAAFVGVAAVSESVARVPLGRRTVDQVLAAPEVVAPVLDATAAPTLAPPPIVEATPVPSFVPRVRARGSGARTAGPVLARPVSTRGWVQISSIGTNAPMVRVGLDRNGNMVTPNSAKDIAWLDNGSFPGPTRNAILAGHVNWKGAQGSLARLKSANAGDVVRIGLDGKVYTFSIVWVRQVDPDNANVEELMGPTDVDAVTLVTCGGNFNRQTRHYEERIVARAELVEVT